MLHRYFIQFICLLTLVSGIVFSQELPNEELTPVEKELFLGCTKRGIPEKWPYVRGLYHSLDSKSQELFYNFITQKVKKFIDNPEDKPYFEMETSLIIPVPIEFFDSEVRRYDHFFMDHIKAFIPNEVISTNYNPQTNILTVSVIIPDLPRNLAQLDLYFLITVEGTKYILTLQPGAVAKTSIKENQITITLESLKEDPSYTIVIFHSQVKYVTWRANVKDDLKVGDMEVFLFENLERLCLKTEEDLKRKYEATELQNTLVLLDYLERDCLHYGSLIADLDQLVFNERDQLIQRILEVRSKILNQDGDKKALVSRFNAVLITAKKQKAYSREWLNEYFYLLQGPQLLPLYFVELLLEEGATPITWSEAALACLEEAGFSDPWRRVYAKRVTQKYQALIFEKLSLKKWPYLNAFQEASLLASPYAADVFSVLIDMNAAPTLYLLAEQVINPYQKEAFLAVLKNPIIYKGTELHQEALAINNPYSLRAFLALLNARMGDSIKYVYATQVVRESQATSFELLASANENDAEPYRMALLRKK